MEPAVSSFPAGTRIAATLYLPAAMAWFHEYP